LAEAYFAKQPSPAEIEKRVEGFQSWLEIDLDAITHNLEEVRRKVGVEVIPCVKTNAYGHGLVPVVAHMMTLGVDRFLVAKLWEARQIREARLDCTVINMDPLFTDEQYSEVVHLDVTQTVYQTETASRLGKAAIEQGKTASLWVKIDTGLGRVGVRWGEAVALIEQIAKIPGLRIDGLFSTMSEDAQLDHIQVDRMKQISAKLDSMDISYGIRSMASSNAVLHAPYTYLDAVRPGVILFGLYPERMDMGQGVDLRQAFTLKARIEQVKIVEVGESLTYSRRFVAPKKMQVGTLHIGYSDGYPRGLTQKGLVRVKGMIKPNLGTVSVNHILVDLDGTGAQVGDVVEAISRRGENDAFTLSERAEIMTYTLMVGMNILMPRVYIRNDEPVALSEPRLVN